MPVDVVKKESKENKKDSETHSERRMRMLEKGKDSSRQMLSFIYP
jgi:hypothetical protein